MNTTMINPPETVRSASRERLQRWTTGATRVVTAVALMLTMILAGACNIAGPAGYLILGPEKSKPVWTPPGRDAVGVILIDDPQSIIPLRALRDTIGTEAEELLLAQGVFKDMMASRLAAAHVRSERFGAPISVADVGREVNANYVIHAVVRAFMLTQDGQTFSPLAVLEVRVVDVKQEEQVFPPPDAPTAFAALTTDLRIEGLNLPDSNAGRRQAMDDLARYTGQKLARMFYEHVDQGPPARLQDIRKR